MASDDTKSKPEQSLNKQIILDEDEYTAALSHIITRDFFPSLVHLDATNDYLDAVRSRNPQLIAASVRRLEQVSNTPVPGSSASRKAPAQTPGRTPYASFPSDTPFHAPLDEKDVERASKRPRYDTSLSLDNFQAQYTSEDNSSFTQILEEENVKRREKYAWAWEMQERVEVQRGRMIEARERMLIEPAGGAVPGVREKFRIEAPVPVGLITVAGEKKKGKEDGEDGEDGECGGVGKDKELIIGVKVTSVEEAIEAVMAPRKDQRTAGVDGWKFKTRNSLMFSPDADVSPYHPPAKVSSSEKKADPKVISHVNTRLVEQEYKTNSSGLSEPPSPTRSRIDAAISGTPYRPKSPSLEDINTLVPNLPNPTPEQLGPAAVKQLMTWGTLNATPKILSRPENEDVAEPKTPFHIREMSSREALSRKLANSASKSLRAKAEMMGLRTPGVSQGGKPKGNMGPPSWTPRRAEAAGNLTPAARRLLERSTPGTAKRTEAAATVSGRERDLNRVRWTPTPTSSRRVG